MPKKNFSTAGMDLLGLRSKDNTEPEINAAAETVEKVKSSAIKESPAKKEADPVEIATSSEASTAVSKIQSKKKPTNNPPQAQKLVRKSYYVTPAQHKALKIKAATGETPADKDISTIIRSAIDMYLGLTERTRASITRMKNDDES